MNNPLRVNPLLYGLFLLAVLPNLAFIMASWWTGDERSFINLDYFLPLLCFISGKKIIRGIGVLLFLAIFLVDLLLIVLQHFPSFHFKDIFYLLSFIASGPKIFLLYAAIIICVLAAVVVGNWFLVRQTDMKHVVIAGFLLILINLVSYAMDGIKGEEAAFYRTSWVSSNICYFVNNQHTSFSDLLGGDYLVESSYYHATTPWTESLAKYKPLNKKLFLIIVESWGQPLNSAIQEDILKNLKAKKDLFDYFEQGSFDFRGFTVEGELRELCQLYPTTLDLYKVKTGFQHCLPHQLNTLGYKTHAIHGGGSTIYGRKEWWPKAGFKQRTFQEDLHKPVNCIPFDGICDWDILSYIKQTFAKDEKQFNYWLTLTSHFEYYEHDIHNKRFNCSAYHIPGNLDACRNLMLQAQLFDYLAKLVAAPEMKGVEFIIVGDHPPPLLTAKEVALFKTKEMKDGQVGWLHFKIKDN